VVEPELRPLVEVLGEIELLRPWMVLQRGRQYWPLKFTAMLARHDVSRGPEWSRESIMARRYWWETDEEDRVVIWWMAPGGPRVLAAEPGSPMVPARDEP
jgi:hypothetical protein